MGRLALILLAAALAAPVLAQQATEQRVALVIGNSAYKESPLANPVNDATDIAKALSDVGFKVILKRNANTRDMRQAIRDFGTELRRAHVGLFYFAGHGVQVKGNNYLVPVGADIQSEADAEDLSLDANYVLRTMEESQVKVSIVILDACRNNPFARSFRSASRGLAQMTAATGSLIAFATAPGSTAADGTGRNGIYTKYLLQSLRQPDTDILKVFQRTRAGVVKETGGKQTPWESTSLVGDFYFALAAPPSATRTDAGGAPAAAVDPVAVEMQFWDSIKDSKSADEVKTYLDQYPDGKFSGLARARIKTLEAEARKQASTQVALAPPSTQTTRPSLLSGGLGSVAGAAPGSTFKDCDVCPEMVVIPAGSFTMGSPQTEQQRDSDEGPQHQVSIARKFAAGKFEVMFDEWDACVRDSGCGQNPSDSGWGRGKRPAINVSWDDARQYVQWLSRKTGRNYRLLTEAEWEYVARAGTTTPFSFGASISPQQANYDTKVSYAGSPTATSPGQTVPVGSYSPNAFGLYDVHGNVWEWVEDCRNANYNGAPTDGSAWSAGDCGLRVLRGGSWNNNPLRLRSAFRIGFTTTERNNNFGLRVAGTD